METIQDVRRFLDQQEALGATHVAIDEGGLELVVLGPDSEGQDAEGLLGYEVGGIPVDDSGCVTFE